jgi:hypothetical protein
VNRTAPEIRPARHRRQQQVFVRPRRHRRGASSRRGH